jgi:hypothetical protein
MEFTELRPPHGSNPGGTTTAPQQKLQGGEKDDQIVL